MCVGFYSWGWCGRFAIPIIKLVGLVHASYCRVHPLGLGIVRFWGCGLGGFDGKLVMS